MNEVIIEKKSPVGKITLNRPEFGNAFSLESYTLIKEAVEQFGLDDEVRVIVITGNGKNFSAGGDIKRFKMLIETETYIEKKNVIAAGNMTNAIKQCPKPVVAMINGAAAGAGCALALSCDFRVIENKGKLSMGFINMGFSGDTGAFYFLERIVGTAKASEMMMLSPMVKAEEALSLGLVTKVAEEGKLEEETNKLVEVLINKPTQAIARQKRLSYEFFYRDLSQFNIREADYMRETSMTEDHETAVKAFLEKKSPVFSGK